MTQLKRIETQIHAHTATTRTYTRIHPPTHTPAHTHKHTDTFKMPFMPVRQKSKIG